MSGSPLPGLDRRPRDPSTLGRPGRILIVDDLFSVRIILRTILTGAGHTIVAEAATGREAVSLYLLFRPDVVLMDITMPEQDGLSAMEEILRLAPQAQIVVCTALSFKWVAGEALRRGACDFIVKPFRPEIVLAAVGRALLRAGSEAPARPGNLENFPTLTLQKSPMESRTARAAGDHMPARQRWNRN